MDKRILCLSGYSVLSTSVGLNALQFFCNKAEIITTNTDAIGNGLTSLAIHTDSDIT